MKLVQSKFRAERSLEGKQMLTSDIARRSRSAKRQIEDKQKVQ